MNMFNIGGSNNELKLTDYKKIWSKFCFLDESGSLNDPLNPFFTVGLVKSTQPYYLYDKIIYERGKRHFYDEMKFNKLSKNNIEFAKFTLDTFLNTENASFVSYSLDKQGSYFNRTFGGDPWKAYEDITVRLISNAFYPNEIIILIADYVTTPKGTKFEINVKRRVNEEQERLVVAGVCRFDSKSNDMLQLVDLLIGAVNYDLKLTTGIIQRGDKYKRRFVEYFKNKVGVKNFLDGFKIDKHNGKTSFNIFVDKDSKQRLISNKPTS